MKNSNDLVSVYRVYETIKAELIKGLLEAEGIPCFLKADNAGGSLSYFTTTTGIEIIVNKKDAEEAYKIIHDNGSQ